MKFKIGDKVKFLNETGTGEISEIIDQKMVKVKIEEGFEIPVMANELIMSIIDSDYEAGTTNIQEASNSTITNTYNTEENTNFELAENLPVDTIKNICIGFLPHDEIDVHNSDIDLYLINDCDYTILYMMGYQENVSLHFLKSGFLEANTKLLITTFSQTEISKIKKIHTQLLFVSGEKYFHQMPVNKFIDIDNIRFYKQNIYKENDFFYEKAALFTIEENQLSELLNKTSKDDILQAVIEKETIPNKKDKVKNTGNNSDIEEVDLHIEEITEDYHELSPGEILDIQMSRFQVALEGAIINKTRKIVFIHGIGNGKLRHEIRKTLKDKYPDLQYQDASFKEYGYGATIIYINV